MQPQVDRDPFRVSGLLNEPLRSLLGPVEPAIQRLFAFDRLQAVINAARSAPAGMDPVESLLAGLGITWMADGAELARIPPAGPAVVVANHPFGLLEGAVLAAVLPRIRPDVRILTNSMLAGIPELRGKCIFVNPFSTTEAVPRNARSLLEASQWLRNGGLLVVFPAGEVAHLDLRAGVLADPAWNPAIARIAQRSGACAVPVFFEGANSLAFQLAGVVHPRLRTASLGRELLNKRGHCLRIRVGKPVPAAALQSFPSAGEAIQYLRCRTYLLDSKALTPRQAPPLVPPALAARMRRTAPVAAETPADRVAAEIERLGPASKLCENAEFAAYVAARAEFPSVVDEIGRLREIAFRKAGEGTGRRTDLDRFDNYYLHLVLWHKTDRQVAGAYRLGPTPDILPRYGTRGLYTSTLFRFRKDFFDRMGPAVELGRSFIRPEYQRQFAPLLLLWKGIARFVALRPECATLFGGVSISREYHAVSRHLIVKFMEAHSAQDLSPLVAPRRAYREAGRLFRRTGLPARVPGSIEELSTLIADLEQDGKGVPILLKQYLKTGGKLLAFNVDRRFSDVLDALIVVDMRCAPKQVLDRYFGAPAAAEFMAWHRAR